MLVTLASLVSEGVLPRRRLPRSARVILFFGSAPMVILFLCSWIFHKSVGSSISCCRQVAGWKCQAMAGCTYRAKWSVCCRRVIVRIVVQDRFPIWRKLLGNFLGVRDELEVGPAGKSELVKSVLGGSKEVAGAAVTQIKLCKFPAVVDLLKFFKALPARGA